MKQTPVPLPAKYLAAMTKPKPETPKHTPQKTPTSETSSGGASRISTTPIPLPNIPSLPRASDPKAGEEQRAPELKGEEGIELPDVPADSSAFVERMISKLHRVSGVEG